MKVKKLITWLCIAALLVQPVLVGFPSIDAKAAEPQAQAVSSDQGQIYYYDLADGNYFLSGDSITVNGAAMASGTELDAPGDYAIVKTFTDRDGNAVTQTQTVVLYKQGDASPDGEYNVKDLVAMKKHLQGIEITKAGAMAIDAYTNKPGASLMREVLLGIKTAETAFPRVGRPLSYQAGSNSVMPIGGFAGPGYLNPAVVTDIQSGALTDFRTDAIYSLLADAGINLITATTNATADGESVEQVQQLELALAEKYGISMFVQPSYASQAGSNPEYFEQYLKELSGYASFAGITLQDEPWTQNYHPTNGSYTTDKGWSTHKALAQMTNAYSNLTGYTNLLPYWSSMGSEEKYAAYLEEYFTNYVNPKQLAFDYYVFSDGENVGGRNASEYFTNLKLIKAAADAHNVPFWATVQAGNFVSGSIIRDSKDTAYMTDGMTRWTVHTALAYGAQGITYYPLVQPYNYALQKNWLSTTKNTYNYDRNGIIGADGTTTPYYDYIKNVNQQILAVDEVLLNAVNNGLVVTEGTAAASETGSDLYGYGAMTHLLSANTEKGAMAGSFNYYGKDAYYVVNYDYNEDQDITLHFDGDYALSVTVNGSTQLVNTEKGAYTMKLRAGDAALVLVNGENAADAQAVIAQIDAIPENAEMPKYYTAVVNAQAAYDKLDKVGKLAISPELTEKLTSLTELAASYGPVYTMENTVVDTEYGIITELTLDNAAKLTDSLHSSDIPAQYGEVVFYVYNPTDAAVSAAYNTMSVILNPGWTMVTVPVSVYGAGENTLAFAAPVSGQWKVTRFYGKNDANLTERVQSAIDALPDAVNLSLSHEEQVQEARAMYEALSTDLRAHVNTAKLIACEKKLIALKQELAGKLPLVIPNASISVDEEVVNEHDVYDATYEKVMTFADADYFAIPSSLLTEGYKTSKSAVLYVYNPTEQNAYLGVQLGDNGWIHRDRVTLYAGKWTAVDLLDRGTTHTYEDTSFVDNYLTSGETLYFYAVDGNGAASTFAEEGWMVSGVYGMNAYKAGDTVVYDVVANEGLPGTKTGYEIVADDNFGSVFAFESTSYFVLSAEMKSKEFKSCQDVAFYIYNPTDNLVTGNIVAGDGYINYVALRPNSWNRIVLADYAGIEGSQFLSNSNNIEFNMNLPATENGAKWKITNFYGTVELADSAEEVNALITALPDANAIGDSHRAAINKAMMSYNALSVDEQAKVENVEKLTACTEKVAQWDALAEKAVISATTGMIPTHSDDNTYGTVWAPNAGDTYVVIKSTDAVYTNCATVNFSIYNPTNSAVGGFIQCDKGWTTEATFTLTPNAWTKITLNQKALSDGYQLISADVQLYLYVNFAGEGWKISSVFGSTAEELDAEAADTVEAMMGDLPAQAATDEARIQVLNLKTTVDAKLTELSEAARQKVISGEKYTQLTALYQSVADAGYSIISASDAAAYVPNVGAEVGNNGRVEKTNVTGWGDVYGISLNVADKTGSYRIATPEGYAGYENLVFAAYNPLDEQVGMVVYDAGWNNSKVVNIPANSWGMIPVEDAYTGNAFCFVVINTTKASTAQWLITGIMAQPVGLGAVQEIDAMIGTVPAVSTDLERIQILQTMQAVEAKLAEYDENTQASVKTSARYIQLAEAYTAVTNAGYRMISDSAAAIYVPNVGAEVGNNGTVEKVSASGWGDVYSISFNVAETNGSYRLAVPADHADYGSVNYAAYNPLNEEVTMVVYDKEWSNSKVVSIPANSWGLISVEAVYTNEAYFFVVVNTAKASTAQWLITGMIAQPAGYEAIQEVDAMIGTVPAGTTDLERIQILQMKTAVDAKIAEYDETSQNAVKASAKYTQLAEAHEVIANAGYSIISAADATAHVPNVGAEVGNNGTVEKVSASGWGDVYSITFNVAETNGSYRIATPDGYTGYENLVYAAYNPLDEQVGMVVYDAGWNNSKVVNIPANSWGLIPVEAVYTGADFFFVVVNSTKASTATWRITGLMAQPAGFAAVQEIETIIGTVPAVTGDLERIQILQIKQAVDAKLAGYSENSQNAVKANAKYIELNNACQTLADAGYSIISASDAAAYVPNIGADVGNNGTMEKVSASGWGDVYSITFNAAGTTGSYRIATPDGYAGYENLVYAAYNPLDEQVGMVVYDAGWNNSKVVNIPANSWGLIPVEAVYTGAGYFFVVVNTTQASTAQWLITGIMAQPVGLAAAQEIASMIGTLPENVDADEEKLQILQLKLAVDTKLAEYSENAQNVVKAGAKYTELAEIHKTVADAGYSIISASDAAAYVPNIGADVGNNGTVEKVSASGWGDVYSITFNAAGTTGSYRIATPDGYAGYENLVYAAYNPLDEQVGMVVYDAGWNNSKVVNIPANSWGLIPVEAVYTGAGYFFVVVNTTQASTAQWLITGIMAQPVGFAAVQEIEAVIGTVPAVTGDLERIQILQIKQAVDAKMAGYSENTQNAVKANAKYIELNNACQTLTNEGYSIISASDAAAYVPNIGAEVGNNGTVEKVSASGWGDVYSITFNVTETNGSYRIATPDGYAGYENLTYAVYNPLDSDVSLVMYDSGWGGFKPLTIPANSWSLISVDAAYTGGAYFFIVVNTTQASTAAWQITGLLGKKTA